MTVFERLWTRLILLTVMGTVFIIVAVSFIRASIQLECSSQFKNNFFAVM